MYFLYLKEREDKEVFTCRGGFITYKIMGDECYIDNIYVIPEYRKSGIATNMADKVAEIAKNSGCRWLTGSVSPEANNSHASLLVLVDYGMKLKKAEKDIVFLGKEI